jgi:3D (Asp-Asp-Asp) domain-containing protein
MIMSREFLFLRVVPAMLFFIALGVSSLAKAGAVSSKSTFSKGARACAVASESAVPVPAGPGRLARVTAYWPGEDYFTNRHLSATGVRLRRGFCAVDAAIIPYGSMVHISGLGSFLAMDTGSAVISRKAARESGHTWAERSAMVIDLFFPSRRAGEAFSREGPKFAMVMWEAGGELADK